MGVLVVIVVVVSAVVPAVASAESSSVKTFAPRFHKVLGQALAGSGGLVFVQSSPPGGVLFGIMPNGAGSVNLVPPACAAWNGGTPLIGGGVLLYSCSNLELYRPSLRAWTSVTLDPSQQICDWAGPECVWSGRGGESLD